MTNKCLGCKHYEDGYTEQCDGCEGFVWFSPKFDVCEQCGRCRDDVEKVKDPYAWEMYGEGRMMLLCHDCLVDRVMSV